MRKRVRLNERQLHSLFYDYLEGMGIVPDDCKIEKADTLRKKDIDINNKKNNQL